MLTLAYLLTVMAAEPEDPPDPQPTLVEEVTVEARKDDLTGIATSATDGAWAATDPIPMQVAGVTIDRFGGIDPALGGETSRYSLSAETHRIEAGFRRRFHAYAVAYDLDLLSNFTYCLDRGADDACALDDDEFLQQDDRVILGLRFEQVWSRRWSGRAPPPDGEPDDPPRRRVRLLTPVA